MVSIFMIRKEDLESLDTYQSESYGPKNMSVCIVWGSIKPADDHEGPIVELYRIYQVDNNWPIELDDGFAIGHWNTSIVNNRDPLIAPC